MTGFQRFFIIWLGQAVSAIGSGLTSFAVGVWIFERTHEVTKFAFVALTFVLPGILLSPFLGAVADRFDRRKLIIIADFGSAACVLAICVLFSLGALQLWQLYVLTGLSSAFGCLLWPALTALSSQLVPKEQLGKASGLTSMAEAVSIIFSPILAVAVIAGIGMGAVFVFDAVSFGIAIVATSLVRTERVASKAGSSTSFFGDAMFGFRYVIATPGLLGLLLFFMNVNLTSGYLNSLFTPLALLTVSKSSLSIVLMIGGFAMLAGSAAMSAWGGPKRKINGILIVAVLYSITQLMLAGKPSFGLFVAALTLCFAGIPLINGCSQAIWQRKVPLEVQGRVFAARRVFALAMMPISLLTVGPLADRLFEPSMRSHGTLYRIFGGLVGDAQGSGIRAMFLILGIWTLFSSILILTHRRVRNVESELPDAVEPAATPA